MRLSTFRGSGRTAVISAISVGVLVVAASLVGNRFLSAESPSATVLLPLAAVGQASVDSQNVVGHDKCAECHKAEVAAWQQSPHAQKSFAMLSEPKAPEFAKAMGVTGDLSVSMCADCHATKTAATVIKGVSCEACHGASGSENGAGWFSVHTDYGNDDKDREAETREHRTQRVAACDASGMNQSADIYEIAHNCLSCHTVPNEKLVNAGHPTSKQFEIVEWSQGSVRHNFQMNQAVNAEAPSLWTDPHWNGAGRTPKHRQKLMFVVGQLVDLEISLRSRAGASDGDFGDAVNRRISGTIRELEDAEHVPEVEKALQALSGIERSTLREFGPGDKQLYGGAAAAVATAAKAIAKNHDGRKLGEIDLPSKAEGEPYQP